MTLAKRCKEKKEKELGELREKLTNQDFHGILYQYILVNANICHTEGTVECSP